MKTEKLPLLHINSEDLSKSLDSFHNVPLLLFMFNLKGGYFMKPSNLKSKINTIVGSIGAFIGIFVFIAYIPQILANLGGAKGQPWQPAMAAFSCLIWVIYGWTKEPKKDYILIIPNAFGVILGFLAFITAL